MVGPDQASPAQGAASKTDSPQSSQKSAAAEKPARFAVGVGNNGYFVFQDDGFGSLPGLASLSFAGLGGQGQAHALCALLNALNEERRGDNPSDVQRQLLEELRELVKLQRDSMAMVQPALDAAKAMVGGARPEPNVNDLMLEVGRAFGLSDLQTMNLDNLKGFCEGAWHMQHVPQKAKQPLLMLVARGALSATPEEVSRVKAILKGMGLA